ncbi:coiled-coil domain-containing protein 138-like [Acipenser ruthenus]|uniref:coiled-coil domain-containing protein 138-like n=1 Tax=Acipenser ruthenus TaxID=7906 RepID=UPI00145A7185|nr:coiled-coil domain-containing protein 138-like [Acipenser ruthenus]
MDWISDSHLCNPVPEGENESKGVPGQHTLPNNCIQEKCTKLLPLLTTSSDASYKLQASHTAGKIHLLDFKAVRNWNTVNFFDLNYEKTG